MSENIMPISLSIIGIKSPKYMTTIMPDDDDDDGDDTVM